MEDCCVQIWWLDFPVLRFLCCPRHLTSSYRNSQKMVQTAKDVQITYLWPPCFLCKQIRSFFCWIKVSKSRNTAQFYWEYTSSIKIVRLTLKFYSNGSGRTLTNYICYHRTSTMTLIDVALRVSLHLFISTLIRPKDSLRNKYTFLSLYFIPRYQKREGLEKNAMSNLRICLYINSNSAWWTVTQSVKISIHVFQISTNHICLKNHY